MQPNRTVVPLLALIALGVGYLAGMARQPCMGVAQAGPTLQDTQHGSYLSSNADGNTLVVWKLRDGSPASATQYSLVTNVEYGRDGSKTSSTNVYVVTAVVPASGSPPK